MSSNYLSNEHATCSFTLVMLQCASNVQVMCASMRQLNKVVLDRLQQ
jgi:hypothetical protein